MAERELSLNLSEETKDLLVDKGWDPSMGARPLRRAIQRYIEDPLADEVLRTPMEPGSTVEIESVEVTDGEDPNVKITVVAPKKRKKREPVGVGAKGAEGEPGGGEEPPRGELPEEPEVLPEVPDAPPEDEGEPKS
jgi:ATP-dependent Clp protease ATP-binding subunit ClpC